MPADKWTELQDVKLRKLYGKMPIKEVAAQMGRTKAAVTARAEALGLVRWTKAQVARIKELAAAGNTPEQIAKEVLGRADRAAAVRGLIGRSAAAGR